MPMGALPSFDEANRLSAIILIPPVSSDATEQSRSEKGKQ
jgi:hypothetical protein